MSKKKIVVIFISVIGVLVLIVGAFFIFIKGKDQNGSRPIEDRISGIKACDDSQPFTHPPVNYEDIFNITPLGNLNPSGHTFPTNHMYLNFAEGKLNIPVYTPGDIWITDISKMTKFEEEQEPSTDFSISFSPCIEISAYYIHVNTISDKLQSAFDEEYQDNFCSKHETGGNTYENCFTEVDIEITAGEVIGHTAKEGQGNFDLGVYDNRLEIPDFIKNFTYPERMESIYTTACPLDYFMPNIKDKLYSVVGDWDGSKRTIEPICGTLRQDIWGTAQGHWFYKEANIDADNRSEDKNLALVHDVVDYDMGVLSIGTALLEFGLPSSTYIFKPKDSGFVDRDFDQVKPDGNKYCYAAMGGLSGQHQDTAILIEMTSKKTLRIGKLDGNSCGTDTKSWNYQKGYIDFTR